MKQGKRGKGQHEEIITLNESMGERESERDILERRKFQRGREKIERQR